MASEIQRIDLVRHAQDESARTSPSYHPRPESPLTETGIRHAQSVAQDLATDYAGIVYSPVHRATHTAELFAEISGIPLLAEIPDLSEWKPPRCVYGKTADQYDDEYRKWRFERTADPAQAYQDAESLLDLHNRARHVRVELERLAFQSGPLLVVSHKVLLGVIVHLGLGPAESFQRATRDPWAHCQVRTLDSATLVEP